MCESDINDMIKYIEDKRVLVKKSWYIHATRNFDSAKNIFENGIKCASLLGKNQNGGFNGSYYISVYKASKFNDSEYDFFSRNPIFVLDDIKVLPTFKPFYLSSYLFDSKVPVRVSDYKYEYQVYLEIPKEKIVGFEYSLAYMLHPYYKSSIYRLKYLKELVLYLDSIGVDIPIYDFSGGKEVNKSKLLSLKL